MRQRRKVETVRADAAVDRRLPVYFHSREGIEPPHVHVRKGDANAKLWLQPVRLAFSEGYNPSELRRIRVLTFEHQVFFIERWHEYFGDQR